MDKDKTVGINIEGGGSAAPDLVETVANALVNLMNKAFETRMEQSVVNNAIDTFRELATYKTNGPTSVNGCNIRMGDDWYLEKDEYEDEIDSLRLSE